MPAIVMPRWKRVIFAWAFPWVVVLAGVAAMYIGFETVRAARSSVDWPVVDGTVVRTTVQTERSSRDNATSGPVTYRPIVVYEYAVNGTKYEAQRRSFGESATGDPADARRVLDQYPVGAAVRVHYDPGQPAQAVLTTGMDGIPWFFVGLGSVFVVVGLLFAWLFPRVTTTPA